MQDDRRAASGLSTDISSDASTVTNPPDQAKVLIVGSGSSDTHSAWLIASILKQQGFESEVIEEHEPDRSASRDVWALRALAVVDQVDHIRVPAAQLNGPVQRGKRGKPRHW